MVLLNLDARLKSLPLPFGRKCGSGNNNHNTNKNPPASPVVKRHTEQVTSSKHTTTGSGSPSAMSSAESTECVQTGKWSASISEALLNYSLVGPSIQLACGACANASSGFKLNQTLPPSFNFGGSTTSLLTETLPETRCKRSYSTMENKSSKIRRRLTLNPAWKASREVRRSRSLNANSDMPTDGEQRSPTTPTASPTFLRKRHKPLVVKKISAKELEANQTIAGYLERKGMSSQWNRYWNVLHEGTLFCFLTSDDNVTVDVLNLNGYSVSCMVDKFRGKRFVLQLSHENFTSLHLSLDTREDMDNWLQCLTQALKRPSSTANEQNELTAGACADCESNRSKADVDVDDVGIKRKQVKQKLLEEMLRQKHELERKQAERQKKQLVRNGLDSPDRSTAPDFLLDEQRTSNVTHLRQRRMSTQLKMETIQKQIEKPGGAKRGLFGFGKAKKLDENKNVFLQDQLKELNEKLHKIDSDLSQVENDNYNKDVFDVNQNRKPFHSSSSTSLVMSENGNDTDDDLDTSRSKTLKSAVQKWTNKTFSKSSVKKKQGNTSSEKIFPNGSVPDLTIKQNGGMDYHSDIATDSDMNSTDEFLESSVTDLTRPLSDLRLDLSPNLNRDSPHNGHSGSASPSSLRYHRSTSRSSTMSSLSSPRREIDPSVLAEIDAFEELTKQVLGARSKDIPAK